MTKFATEAALYNTMSPLHNHFRFLTSSNTICKLYLKLLSKVLAYSYTAGLSMKLQFYQLYRYSFINLSISMLLIISAITFNLSVYVAI